MLRRSFVCAFLVLSVAARADDFGHENPVQSQQSDIGLVPGVVQEDSSMIDLFGGMPVDMGAVGRVSGKSDRSEEPLRLGSLPPQSTVRLSSEYDGLVYEFTQSGIKAKTRRFQEGRLLDNGEDLSPLRPYCELIFRPKQTPVAHPSYYELTVRSANSQTVDAEDQRLCVASVYDCLYLQDPKGIYRMLRCAYPKASGLKGPPRLSLEELEEVLGDAATVQTRGAGQTQGF